MIELRFQWDEKDLAMFKNNSFVFASEMDKAIDIAAHLIRNTAVTSISRGTRTGRIYKRGRIRHQASAIGEYPKTDTGRLVGSIRIDKSYLTADIGSDVNYAEYLETKSPKQGGRPWLQPSFDANKDRIELLFNNALKRTFHL